MLSDGECGPCLVVHEGGRGREVFSAEHTSLFQAFPASRWVCRKWFGEAGGHKDSAEGVGVAVGDDWRGR